MIKATLPNRIKPRSLNTQIRDAERQVLKRQRVVGARTDRLVRKIHQQMTAPATLLLAGGIGFILGEITHCRQGSTRRGGAAGASPLRSALKFATSIQTLYSALPLVWILKFFRRPGAGSSARTVIPSVDERFPVQPEGLPIDMAPSAACSQKAEARRRPQRLSRRPRQER